MVSFKLQTNLKQILSNTLNKQLIKLEFFFFEMFLFVPKHAFNYVHIYIIYTGNYTESHKNIKYQLIIQNTSNKTKYIFIHLMLFQNSMSVGLPGPLRTASELKKGFAHVKNTPDAATLTLRALSYQKKK